MNSKTQKGFKPFIIKIVVIAMGICYAFGPSHHQIYKVLHLLTHQLEMPETVLVHSKEGHLEHRVHGSHHISVEHKNNHQHGFLEFIDKILMASNAEHDPDNANIKPYKIDKHILTQEYSKQQDIWLIAVKHVFSIIQNNTQRGFLTNVFQPPICIT